MEELDFLLISCQVKVYLAGNVLINAIMLFYRFEYVHLFFIQLKKCDAKEVYE